MNQPAYLPILGSNEATASWLDYLEGIGPPTVPVELPDGEAFIGALHDLDVLADDIGTVVRLQPDTVNDPGLRWLLERCVHSLLLHMNVVSWPPAFPKLPPDFGEVGRYFYAFVYVAMLPHTRNLHRRRGIPDDITRATLADVGRHFLIHREQHGTHGMSGADWLMLHARGMIFQIGRLQFERGHLGTSTSRGIKAADFPCEKGDPVIAVHIPGHMGPMSPDACDDSFAEARPFFREHFPEEDPRLALCHSWLLDEQLGEYLPESSNIMVFQRRFRQAYRPEPNNRPTLEFVFRTPDRPLDELPQRTTLERAVVRHLRDGRQWHGGVGWTEWQPAPDLVAPNRRDTA
ncbi:MAG: acyltransferase domain-containing protein [Chloroflexota bacterium]|nr:acyltransferase domain-containing protein [Chloroflexota bacterium]